MSLGRKSVKSSTIEGFVSFTVNETLVLWFTQQWQMSVPLSAQILQEKAKFYREIYNLLQVLDGKIKNW